MKNASFRSVLAVIAAILLSSCASTTVTGAWRDEAYTGRPHKALVILVTAEPIIMRTFEDEFSKQLRTVGVAADPGYSTLPSDRPLTREEIAAAVEKNQADSLFITRLVDKQSYETYYPGSVYAAPARGVRGPGWNDYYSRGYTYYHATPGYVTQQNILYVETQLYDTKTEQLIWSVMTQTLVGSSMESEVKDFVKVIMKNLSKSGLVRQP